MCAVCARSGEGEWVRGAVPPPPPRALVPQTITNRILKCRAAVHGRPSARPRSYGLEARNSRLCSPALLRQSSCQAKQVHQPPF